MRKTSLALAALVAAGLASTGASADTVIATAKLDTAVAPVTAAALEGAVLGGVPLPGLIGPFSLTLPGFLTTVGNSNSGDGVCPACLANLPPLETPDDAGAVVHH